MPDEKNSYTSFENFAALDIRVGTVTGVEEFPEARISAYKITLDFGSIGQKRTSAQITDLYTPEDLVGTQVVGVVNFPPKSIAGFSSEVLILGVYTREGVTLLRPEHPADNGDTIG